MGDWKTAKLKELGVIQTGTTPSTRQPENYGSHIPFIKPPSFRRDGTLNYDGPHLSLIGLEKARLIPKNSVMMVCIGATIGKTGYTDREVSCNQQINSITLNENLDHKFFYYLFSSPGFFQKVVDGSSQATLPMINKSKWQNIEVSFPPLPEQRRLVTLLGRAFADIERARALLERNLRNAEELFESRLSNVFEKPNEGWETKTFQEICSRITDGTHQTPTYFEEGYTFLSSRNVKSGKINWDNVKYIDEAQHQKMYGRLAPRIDDILLAKNGTTGVAAIVDVDRVFDIYVSLALLRPTGEVLPKLLLQFINSPMAKKQFNSRLKGVGVPNLHLKEIRQVKISFPISVKKQKKLIAEISDLKVEMDKIQSHYRTQLHHLTTLKQSLLQRAFAGKL